MFVMKGNDSASKSVVFDISTTRLFSLHAYCTKGTGTLKLSQSNFSEVGRFEPITEVTLDTSDISKQIAVIAIKDAPTRLCRIELVTVDPTCNIEIEIIYK